MSRTNQALGALIGWGWSPERAERLLDDRAAALEVAKSAVVSELLDALDQRSPPGWAAGA